jgi:tetratricopeptide (TPR) repeat protein
MACVLLSATPQVFADDAEELSEHLLQAELALQNSQYQLAATEYRKAAELSDDPEVAQKAARVAYSYGFNKEALRSAKRWAKLDDENDEALLYVSQLYLRIGEIRNSQRSFEKLLKRGRQPADERLLALIPFLSQEDENLAYELMLKLAKPYKKSAEANYAVAVMALQAGDTETAGERARVRNRTGLGETTPLICSRNVVSR